MLLTDLFATLILTTTVVYTESITCDQVIELIKGYPNNAPVTEFTQPARATKVFCVDWQSRQDEVIWHWLKDKTTNETQTAFGHWMTKEPCQGWWINYFQLVKPDGHEYNLYTRCQIKIWIRECTQQFGPGFWAAQPADNVLNEWAPFIVQTEADPLDTRFAPAGVTLHRNAHFLSRSTGFSNEFSFGELVDKVPCKENHV